MPDFGENGRKLIAMMQWLIVLVLSAYLLIASPEPLSIGGALLVVVALLALNAALLHGPSAIISTKTMVTALVILDTLMVPLILYVTEPDWIDLFVVYFGIVLIAGVSANLKRVLILAALVCLVYGVTALWREEETTVLELVLLRWPLFLVAALLFGSMAEFIRRTCSDETPANRCPAWAFDLSKKEVLHHKVH